MKLFYGNAMNAMTNSFRSPRSVVYLDVSDVFSGAEASLVQLLKYLDRTRYRPVLCFPYPKSHHMRYAEANAEVVYLNKAVAWWMGSDRSAKPIRGTDCLKRCLWGLQLSRLARSKSADIVHVNLLYPKPWWYLWWPKRCGFITVGHARSFPSIAPSQVQRVCDSMICVSNLVKQSAAKVYAHWDSHRIYDPIDPAAVQCSVSKEEAKQALGIAADRRVIASVGLLSPHKGHDTSIEVFRRLGAAYPDTVLYIAGGGNEKERVRLAGLAADCGLGQRILFSPGQLARIDLVYAASEFVFSLTKNGEAFGRVPLEAGAASRAVIAPNNGAAPELVIHGKTGFLVDPLNVEEIVDVSTMLLTDSSLQERIGGSARRHVTHAFSPVGHADEVQALYDRLLGLPCGAPSPS